MTDHWQMFWSNYGPQKAETDEDLLRQVAHTVKKQPIPEELVIRMIGEIVARLELSRADNLMDLCCGNGFFTYELAAHVARVIGIDFVSRNIRTAQMLKSSENVTYVVADAAEPFSGLAGDNFVPNKFLMHYSLGYFTPTKFASLVRDISRQLAGREFLFLLTGIPNADLKWNFYDTPERRAQYRTNEALQSNINDGLGRWWQASEIERICKPYGLEVVTENQSSTLSQYRMDTLIISRK